MLYGGMVDQFQRMDEKRLSVFHTKDLSDIASALWEKRKKSDTIHHQSQLHQYLYYHQHLC